MRPTRMQWQNFFKRASTESEKKQPIIRYATFRQLVHDHAFERYQGRISNSRPGDHLSDWLEAERELHSKWRIAITLGMSDCKIEQYQHVFEGRNFGLHGIPCTFKTVALISNSDYRGRIRLGLHAVLFGSGASTLCLAILGYTHSNKRIYSTGMWTKYRELPTNKTSDETFQAATERLNDMEMVTKLLFYSPPLMGGVRGG